MGKALNLVGMTFGRLTVISRAENKRDKKGRSFRMWKCVCDCGNTKTLTTRELTSGNTKSCGNHKAEFTIEKNTTHGLSKTKLYRVWSTMKDRCFRPSDKRYEYYGARGITVCEEWRNDFQIFYDWAIKNGYKDGLTIERKDVNGNYCPKNCCWIEKKEQSKNRTNSHFITYNGETKTLSEWSRELHIDRGMFRKWEKELGSGEKAMEHILNSPKHIMRTGKEGNVVENNT